MALDRFAAEVRATVARTRLDASGEQAWFDHAVLGDRDRRGHLTAESLTEHPHVLSAMFAHVDLLHDSGDPDAPALSLLILEALHRLGDPHA